MYVFFIYICIYIQMHIYIYICISSLNHITNFCRFPFFLFCLSLCCIVSLHDDALGACEHGPDEWIKPPGDLDVTCIRQRP